MRALLHKELRQALPAQLLVAALFSLGWFLIADPERVLAPYVRNQGSQTLTLAMIYILEGLFLGFAQFGMERWSRTEAFLVHRATGHGAAFAAKLVAGGVSLLAIIVLPPLLYGLWHLGVADSVGGGSAMRLVYAALASCTALGAYAIGVFASQLRHDWSKRVMLGVLGGASLLFFTKIAAAPVDGLGHASALRYLLVQVTLAVAVLAVAYGMFRSGDDPGRPWPRITAIAFALVAIELFVPPYLVAPAALSRAARKSLLASYPQLVEDAEGALYLATPRARTADERGQGQAWDLTDASGRAVPRELAERYDGFGFDYDPYLTLFRPESTPLQWDRPRDDGTEPDAFVRTFVFDGPWRQIVVSSGECVLATQSGELWLKRSVGRDHSRRPDWILLRELSDSVAVVYSLTRGANGDPLFVDLARGQLWTLNQRDPAVGLELTPVSLPEGDSLVGVERLQGLFRLRAGLFEPIRTSDAMLVRGERGLYGWTGEAGLRPWDELRGEFPTSYPEDEAAGVALSLTPTDQDGLGFRLEVRDPASGALRFAHDFRPTSARQRGAAALACVGTLISSPLGSLVSWLRAPPQPRDVRRLSLSMFSDPLLTGQRHVWLLALNLLLGATLALLTWRRLGDDPARRELRVLWTLAVLALGLAPFFLCALFEPRPRRASVARQPREARREALVIQTA